MIYLDVKGRNLDTEKLFSYQEVSRFYLTMWSHLVIPTPGITELATLLILSESLAEVELKPLTIGPCVRILPLSNPDT